MKAIQSGTIPSDMEVLTRNQRYNEYILTSIRTNSGIDLNHIQEKFGVKYLELFLKEARSYIKSGKILIKGNRALLSRKGKILADRITADLFI
jgi:oxygen-independent coproporphyrinogen-3 oxidase